MVGQPARRAHPCNWVICIATAQITQFQGYRNSAQVHTMPDRRTLLRNALV